jgi:hypothetical protein
MATGSKETGQIEAQAARASDRPESRGFVMTADFDPWELPCQIPAYWYQRLAEQKRAA